MELYMRQDEARRMARASLQDVHQQNPIQRIINYILPNQPQVYSIENQQQQQQSNGLIYFLSPPQKFLQRQHNDVIPIQIPIP